MYKKRKMHFIASIILFISLMSVTSEATSDYINKASIHQGVITINATSDGTMAVRVVKDNLHNDYVVSGTTRLPLQHGK